MACVMVYGCVVAAHTAIRSLKPGPNQSGAVKIRESSPVSQASRGVIPAVNACVCCQGNGTLS